MLEVRSIEKRFGEVHAVKGISFSVNAGEIFGLLGPNGAGKTTTIHMMCGLLFPDSGEILLAGQPFPGPDRNNRQVIGYGGE